MRIYKSEISHASIGVIIMTLISPNRSFGAVASIIVLQFIVTFFAKHFDRFFDAFFREAKAPKDLEVKLLEDFSITALISGALLPIIPLALLCHGYMDLNIFVVILLFLAYFVVPYILMPLIVRRFKKKTTQNYSNHNAR